MQKAWVEHKKPALFLAPMEGVTDAPMRALLTSLPGFTHCVTEFLRISHMVLPQKCYPRHAVELKSGSVTPTGTPVIFQLLGGDPEKLAESASLAVKMGAAGIDLNFGCPAPTVNKHDGGATLLKYPDRIETIIRAVRARVPSTTPVSAKMRLGWDDMNAIHENARRAEIAGASWLTIHGRTKFQGYIPPAYWKPIGEIRKALSIPVIANGEIWTLKDFQKCQEETGCEHFMLGRGALANPYLAQQVAQELGILPKNQPLAAFPNPEEWRELFTQFLAISEPLSDNENYSLKRMKQWMRYVASRNDFADFEKIKRIETVADLKLALEKISYPLLQGNQVMETV